MSAFILSDKHFQVIAQYITENKIQCMNAQDLANRMKKINIESVDYRYNEKTRFSKVKFSDSIHASEYSKYDIIRLIECWNYQSCENEFNTEYWIMAGFLFSFFTNEEKEKAKLESKLWSI